MAEVLAPSTERTDTQVKVTEDFSVSSIQHYLIVDPVRKVVIQQARGPSGDISRQEVTAGEINLTPPGMTVPFAELLPEIG